ncbi:hypothetical protein G6F50_018247 [Rhizopus delemar]|uniref:Uncharacterized protein n=1 Tax=Rhizopus delemar TaxID=936053 RepID=A0A9P7BZM5_9FUNG|nr:hypothetical protein G6F50_018247 [Rhizopus delemar]
MPLSVVMLFPSPETRDAIAERGARINGSSSSLRSSNGTFGPPSLNSITALPVIPVMTNSARVSCRTGMVALMRTRAIARLGSRGERESATTSPIVLRLY